MDERRRKVVSHLACHDYSTCITAFLRECVKLLHNSVCMMYYIYLPYTPSDGSMEVVKGVCWIFLS